jgi:hypothetical protein
VTELARSLLFQGSSNIPSGIRLETVTSPALFRRRLGPITAGNRCYVLIHNDGCDALWQTPSATLRRGGQVRIAAFEEQQLGSRPTGFSKNDR